MNLRNRIFAFLKDSLKDSQTWPSTSFNPLNRNSDQHQISPCNINVYSAPEVMRIKGMITQGEFLDILITAS